jgi:pyruvate ferredoxin oxidoreductase delta subunit
MSDGIKRQVDMPKWHELALGTAVIYAGSARALKTGDWRSSRPIWHYVGEATGCIQCGVCTIYCPEGCIDILKLSETGYDLAELSKRPESGITPESPVPAADLDYCKGCGICVRECPTHCIELVPEEV